MSPIAAFCGSSTTTDSRLYERHRCTQFAAAYYAPVLALAFIPALYPPARLGDSTAPTRAGANRSAPIAMNCFLDNWPASRQQYGHRHLENEALLEH